jgi:prefoldin beta subunit
MSGELPPQIQNQLAQLQQLQQQAQAVISQKSQIESLIRETDAALKELEKSSDDAVIYKSVGELLFKAEKPKLVEELKERKEMMDLRLKTMSKQEERIQSRFTQLQDQLKQSLGQIPPKGGSEIRSYEDKKDHTAGPGLSQDIAPGF